MKPEKMEPHRLNEIRGALRERPRIMVAQWGNATVYDLMSHIAALEAEVAQARDAALEEAGARVLNRCCSAMRDVGCCEHRRCDYYQNVLTEIRSLKSPPAQKPDRQPWQWSSQQPERAHLGDEDRRPDDSSPVEMASEANGLLPKKRRREHEYGEEKTGAFGEKIARCTTEGCQAYRVRSRGGKHTTFAQGPRSPPLNEPGPCEGRTP